MIVVAVVQVKARAFNASCIEKTRKSSGFFDKCAIPSEYALFIAG